MVKQKYRSRLSPWITIRKTTQKQVPSNSNQYVSENEIYMVFEAFYSLESVLLQLLVKLTHTISMIYSQKIKFQLTQKIAAH